MYNLFTFFKNYKKSIVIVSGSLFILLVLYNSNKKSNQSQKLKNKKLKIKN